MVDEERTVHARWRSEAGATSGSWLVHLLVVLGVLAVIGYEVVAIGLASLSVDEGSRQVARAASAAYRDTGGSLDATTTAAAEAARVHDATVTAVAVDGEELIVTLERRAPTLLVQRIGPLADLAVREATGRVDLPGR